MTAEETLHDIPLSKLRCKKQVRTEFDLGAIESLAQNLKDLGQLVPIRVTPEDEMFTIEDGERRFRAAQLAKLQTLKAIINLQPISASELLLRQLSINIQRADLSPIERARALQELVDLNGGNASKVCQRTGMAKATVSQLLKLLRLEPTVQAKIEEGVLSRKEGYQLSQFEDPAEQVKEATRLVAAKSSRQSAVKTRFAPSTTRLTLPLGQSNQLTISGSDLTLDVFIQQVDAILLKARRALKEGLGIDTFVRMLRDQINVARKGDAANA
jgi:ParB family transcriptional regulator, chromosome partitioning protein